VAQNATANEQALVPLGELADEHLSTWAEAYFAIRVTTAESSRRMQRQDIDRFLAFMLLEEGSEDRQRWTAPLSRGFLDALRTELKPDGTRRFADRTIARIMAHLKTFARWIHSLRPFPAGNPMDGLRLPSQGNGLEVERALTVKERRQLLDAADALPLVGGRSKDRNRYRGAQPHERPQRKNYRPWRNRAIVYTLIETGMRRTAVTHLDLCDVDFDRRAVTVQEKGGARHRYQISREGLNAIRDYLKAERGPDAAAFPTSPALFLPAASYTRGTGRLQSWLINKLWNDLCAHADVEGKTPHSARHAMGRHIIDKTGNIAAVQRQLGHSHANYAAQYARIAEEELNKVLDDR
jgi:site-specific recombinase XerD